MGAAVAVHAAGRQKWWTLVGGLLAVTIGMGAAFAGLAGARGILAVCGCAAVVVLAVAQVATLRRA